MLWSLAYVVVRRLFELVVLLCRSPGSKELEILVLRHELSILRRQPRRAQLRDADRLSFAEIEKQIRDFARRAEDGSLSLAAVLAPWLYAPADRRARLAWFAGATTSSLR